MRFLTTTSALFALILVVACGDDAQEPGNNQNNDTPQPITHEFEDEGAVCVGTSGKLDPTGGTIEVGETVEIYVQFADCLSSSCSANFDSDCELHQWGSGIYQITSSGSYDDLSPVEYECTADCNDFSTKCGEVTFGGDEVVLIQGDAHHYIEPGSERRCVDEGDAEEPRAVTRSYEDEGPVCFGDVTSGQGLEADEPFFVTVSIEGCLSSSCTADQQAECEIEVDGDEIFVSSSGSYSELTHIEEGGCTDDCGGAVEADCGSLTLAEGTYTVYHGDKSSELTIPSDGAVCE